MLASPGRGVTSIFSFVKDKVWRRIQGWSKKALSKAGKEILLKTIVQAVSIYVMSVFLLPFSLCMELERMMNSFWWGSKGDKGGIKWMAWDRMCAHKSIDGMGFRKIHEFNIAMLGKQG